MADHTDNALRAAIKALDDVVAPALDASNPLAGEQLALVSRFLGFLRARLHYQEQRERFELRHYLALARALRPHAACGPAHLASLFDEAIELGATLSDRACVPAKERPAAIDRLTAVVSVLVRSSADAEPSLRVRIERAVVLASRSLFDAQRAWYLPIGFEPDLKLVPPIETALAAAS